MCYVVPPTGMKCLWQDRLTPSHHTINLEHGTHYIRSEHLFREDRLSGGGFRWRQTMFVDGLSGHLFWSLRNPSLLLARPINLTTHCYLWTLSECFCHSPSWNHQHFHEGRGWENAYTFRSLSGEGWISVNDRIAFEEMIHQHSVAFIVSSAEAVCDVGCCQCLYIGYEIKTSEVRFLDVHECMYTQSTQSKKHSWQQLTLTETGYALINYWSST